MVRDLTLLQKRRFDLLVIGGGIYGACVAWDAALRGLSVALVEKADFGHAASANSLKIIHGGLRYLQDASLTRMRTMVRERRTWLRIAPGLVRPLPFILPTGGSLKYGKVAMGAALTVNDLLSLDRNRGLSPESCIPAGRILSRIECLRRIPGLRSDRVNGGAMWYDAQLLNSERLLFSVLRSAVDHGAVLANYAEVTSFQCDDRGWSGVEIRDTLNNKSCNVSARLIVNCAGAWIEEVLGLLEGLEPAPTFRSSLALNLVTRQIQAGVAVALPSRFRGAERLLFVIPWRNYSLLGTWHSPFTSEGPNQRMTEAIIQGCLEEINAVYPCAALTRKDVYHVHVGHTPAHSDSAAAGPARLMRESAICDHACFGGPQELITVAGVKYTTARYTAERVVDLALRKLGRSRVSCRTDQTMVAPRSVQFKLNPDASAGPRHGGLPPEVFRHLVQEYGSACRNILSCLNVNPNWAEPVSPHHRLLCVEIIHAIRCEMAQTLADVVKRRTTLGAAGPPDQAAVNNCARLVAGELGWDAAKQAAEVDALYASYETEGFMSPAIAS